MDQLEIRELKEEVADIKTDVEQILFILTGTEYEKGQGLLNRLANEKIHEVARYEKLEKRIEMLEKWKDKVVWVGIGLAFGSGIGITELFRILFFK